VTDAFVIDKLAQHDRTDFSCGVDELDRYFRQQAGQDSRRLLANCFVAVEPESRVVAGFYTLASTSIPLNELPDDVQRRLPRYPRLPAALIGRLAVDVRFKQRGLGTALLMDAARRALRSDPAVFAVVVEAKDEGVASFYRRREFTSFIGEPLTLYAPLATLQRLFES
jgi:GNAT superfamily N-acetyltransferase